MAHVVFKVNGEVIAEVTGDDMAEVSARAEAMVLERYPSIEQMDNVDITSMVIDIAMPVLAEQMGT